MWYLINLTNVWMLDHFESRNLSFDLPTSSSINNQIKNLGNQQKTNKTRRPNLFDHPVAKSFFPVENLNGDIITILDVFRELDLSKSSLAEGFTELVLPNTSPRRRGFDVHSPQPRKADDPLQQMLKNEYYLRKNE